MMLRQHQHLCATRGDKIGSGHSSAVTREVGRPQVRVQVVRQPPKVLDDGGWLYDDAGDIVRHRGWQEPVVPKLTTGSAAGEADALPVMRGQEVAEYDYYVQDAVEGTLPAELHHGTLLLSAPALYGRWGHSARSAEDADGMVASLTFNAGHPLFFRSRLVRTNLFETEQAAGRRLARGFHDVSLLTGSSPLDGWLSNPLDLSFPGRAGANVLYWAGRVYALSQHAAPWELRAHTLDTVNGKPANLGHSDTTASPPGLVAKYHFVPSSDGQGTQHLMLMRTAQVGLDTLVTFTELDPQGKVVGRQMCRLQQTVSRMILDFAVTGTRIAVLAPPINFNIARFTTKYLLGSCSFAECMDWDPTRPSVLHVVPRVGLEGKVQDAPVTVDLPPLCMTSCVNAYDAPDGSSKLVLDMVATQGLPYLNLTNRPTTQGLYEGQPKPEITRVEVDCPPGSPQGLMLQASVVSHRSAAHVAVHPSRATLPHDHLYATASVVEDPERWGPAQVVMKLSGQSGAPVRTTLWSPGAGHLLGPLTLLPKADDKEGGAWLLTVEHSTGGEAPQLLVIDTADVGAGPVCKVALPGLLPGSALVWTPDLLLGPGLLLKQEWAPPSFPITTPRASLP